MSVTDPSLYIFLGSVNPPQGDVVSLKVVLGCTGEVSSYELLMQNWDKKYSPSGTYPIVEGSAATISVGRGASCPLLLTGKVEKITYPSMPTEHHIKVLGRCVGKSLFSKRVTKTYTSQKGEAIVKDIIDTYVGLSHNRSGELIENTDTTYTLLEYSDTPVIDILNYIASTADKSGVIGFDFRVAPDGKFEFFQRNSKTSSVSLSEKIEESDYTKDSLRVRNKITIYGAADKSTPLDKDSWTDGTLNQLQNDDDEEIHQLTAYKLVGTVVFDPATGNRAYLRTVNLKVKVSVVPAQGKCKITYQKEGGAETNIVTDETFTNTDYALMQHTSVNIWGDAGKDVTVRFYTLIDNASYWVYSKEHRAFADILGGDWEATSGLLTLDGTTKVKGNASIKLYGLNVLYVGATLTLVSAENADLYPVFNVMLNRGGAFNGNVGIILYDVAAKTASHYFTGALAEFFQSQMKVGTKNADGWNVLSGFDWTQIKHVRIDFWPESGLATGNCYIDALFFGGRRYTAVEQDSGSQTKYGMQEYADTDEELFSDNECSLRAKAILDFLKEYAESSPISSTVLDYGTTPILPADKIHVDLPNENVDSDFRVQTGIEYGFEAKTGDLTVSFNVGREAQLLADFIYALRARADQLSRKKVARWI